MLTELDFETRGKVFRSPMPFSMKYDCFEEVLDHAVEAEVSVVVMLVSDLECREKAGRSVRDEYVRLGWQVIQVAVSDYGTPANDASFRDAVSAALEHAKAGRNLLVHCHAGIGRTGMFLACLKRQRDAATGDEAIDWVRGHVEGAVETEAQEEYVRRFLP